MNNLMSSFWNRNRVFLISMTSLFVLVLVGFEVLGIVINVTRSIPLGIYVSVANPPNRGDLVLFYPPENSAVQWARDHRIATRRRFIKRIYGMPGDRVSIDNEGVYVNNELISNSKLLEQIGDGSIVPRNAESGVIPDGFLWLMSEYNEYSFDSRYFGLVPCKNVKTTLKPLFVW